MWTGTWRNYNLHRPYTYSSTPPDAIKSSLSFLMVAALVLMVVLRCGRGEGKGCVGVSSFITDVQVGCNLRWSPSLP